MIIRALLCAPCVALLSAAANAAPASFKSAADFLSSIPHANAAQSQIAQGDLNGDGRADLAIVVTTLKSDKDGEARAHQLYVLLQDAAGAYTVAAASQRVDQVGAGCCWVELVEIKNQSVYIQNNAKTACTMEAATHQFKHYGGAWRLIGHRVYLAHTCEDAKADTEEDTNLLTGKTIATIHGKTKQARTAQGKPRSALLKDFDFYNGFGMDGK
jgi:hypothetical protein